MDEELRYKKICLLCHSKFVDTMLNTLIKGQVTKIQSKTEKKQRATGYFIQCGKARRMNVSGNKLVPVNVQKNTKITKPDDTQIVLKDLKHIPIKEILQKYSRYETEMKNIFNKYKKFSERQCAKLQNEKFVLWSDVVMIMTDDQMYEMARFLEQKLCSQEELGMYTEFIDAVLLGEWALRIFMDQFKFHHKDDALQHIKLQEQEFSK
ncbi:uncharacterized protein LOC131440546 [Malaya genurostris]|uniref:uncharacterized protein LOC131440546 n=1 Tax=Malaya genurostris TaxID=325434 RepID=UPI0026F39BBF|nr:uncharacterized protein LOC131440546 [Malaya genurostris]